MKHKERRRMPKLLGGGLLAVATALAFQVSTFAPTPVTAQEDTAGTQASAEVHESLYSYSSGLVPQSSPGEVGIPLFLQGIADGVAPTKGKVVYLNEPGKDASYNNLVLENNIVYVVNRGTVSFNGSTSASGAYMKGSSAVIYIAPGGQLNCNGGVGSGRNPGNPGLYVPSDKTIHIVGAGKLYANGGNGARGTNGGGGGCSGNAGGTGGAGGGGGGAGIGTSGAWGGTGTGNSGTSGAGGGGGGSITDAYKVGTLNISTSITGPTTKNGNGGGGGSGGSGYGGGGGGGGGGGQGGYGIGTGGCGGGGGGGGGDCDHDKNPDNGGGGYGGGGWSSGGNGGWGWKHSDSPEYYGGGGGGAGSNQIVNNMVTALNRLVTDAANYDVTFDVNHIDLDQTDNINCEFDILPDDQNTQEWTRSSLTFGETTITDLEKVPSRKGYKFVGFSQEIRNGNDELFNSDGTPNFGTNGLIDYKYADSRQRWVAGGTDDATRINQVQSFHTTLYAQWELAETKVLFDAAGGSSSQVKTKTFLGNTDAEIVTPKRPGYVFDGFYTEINGGGEQIYDKDGAYVKKYYGSNADKFMDFCDGSTAYYWSDLEKKWNAVEGQQYVHYYAKWTPVTYYVQYMSWNEDYKDEAVIPLYDEKGEPVTEKVMINGKEETLSSVQKMTYGTFKLPTPSDFTPELTREHYIFKGWNIYSSQDWKMYVPNKEYKGGLGTEESEQVVLYAAWEPQGEAEMVYDFQGGTGGPSRESAYEGDAEYKIAQKVPTRDGYTFLGWNTASDGSGDWYAYNAEEKDTVMRSTDPGWDQYLSDGESVNLKYRVTDVTRGMTFFAIWATNPTIVYNLNGGVGYIPATSHPIDSHVALEFNQANLPTLAGNTFAGWELRKADGSTQRLYTANDQSYQDGDTTVNYALDMPKNDITLYAKWEIQQEPITFEVGSGCHNGVKTGTESGNGLKLYKWDAQNHSAIQDNQILSKADTSGNTLTVDYGETFQFGVFVPAAYDASNIQVSSNGSMLVRTETKELDDGTYYVYRIGTPHEAQNITVDEVGVHEYKVVLNEDGGTFGTVPGPEVDQLDDKSNPVYVDSDGNTYAYKYDAAGERVQGNADGSWMMIKTSGGATAEVSLTETEIAALGINKVPSIVSANVTSYVYGSTITLPDGTENATTGTPGISKNGYEFGGWYTNPDKTSIATAPQITENTRGKQVFYAKWNAVNFKVRYHAGVGHTFADGTTTKVAKFEGQDVVNAYGTLVSLDDVKNDDMFGNTVGVGAGTPGNFIGWSAAEESSQIDYINGQRTRTVTITKDGNAYYAELYAVWEPDYASVVFNTDGGTLPEGVSASNTVAKGAKVKMPTATKANFTFGGWKLSDDTYQANAEVTIDGDTTFVAQWTPSTYTMTFDRNGAEGSNDSQVINFGEPTELKKMDQMGWTAPASETTTQMVNLWTLNADWDDTHADITYATSDNAIKIGDYVADGSNQIKVTADNIGSYKNQYYVEDGTEVYKYTRSQIHDPEVRKNFLGWAKNATATAPDYYDGQTVEDVPAAERALYAVWSDQEPGIYVGFDANGGVWDGDAPQPLLTTSEDGGSHKLSGEQFAGIKQPTRVGYTLAGWTTEKDTGDPIDATYDYHAGSTTLYAKWTPITYTVTLKSSYKNPTSETETDAYIRAETTQTFTYDQAQALYSADDLTTGEHAVANFAPLRNKGLKGWSTVDPEAQEAKDDNDNDIRPVEYADGQVFLNLTATQGNALTLYAIWFADTLNVTYDTQGGSAVPSTMVTRTGVAESDKMGLPGTGSLMETKPKRDGYKFLGWSTVAQENPVAVDGTFTAPDSWYPSTTSNDPSYKKFDYSDASIGDTTFYAYWQKVEYGNVTYYVNDGSEKTFELDDTQYVIGDSVKLAWDTDATTRNGYTFTGWKRHYDDTYTGQKDETLYVGGSDEHTFAYERGLAFDAQWTPVTYKVQYVLGDGVASTVDPLTSDFTYDAALHGQQNVLKHFAGTFGDTAPAGKHFVGWTTQQGSDFAMYEEIGDDPIVVNDNLASTQGATVVLFSVWHNNTATVNFFMNDGAAGTDPTTTDKLKTEENVSNGAAYPAYELAVPTRPGYEFAGFYLADDDTQTLVYDKDLRIVTTGAIAATEEGATVNLLAKWNVATYTVLYLDKDGNELYRDTEAKVGDRTYRTKSASSLGIELDPAKEEELIWVIDNYANNTDATAKIPAGKLPQEGDPDNQGLWPFIARQPSNGDEVKLYAFISGSETFTVRYDANGGSWPTGQIPAAGTVKENHSYDVKYDVVPTRKGYDFCGWSMVLSKSNGQNKMLYTQERYNKMIQELMDQYDANDPEEVKALIPADVQQPFQNDDQGYQMQFSGSENVTLYALWEPSTYTVVYDANGGRPISGEKTRIAEALPRVYDAEEATALYDGALLFEKDNADFKGWGTNDEVMRYKGTEKVKNLPDTCNVTSDGTVILYAIWTNYGAHELEAEVDPIVEYDYNGHEHVLPASNIKVYDRSVEDNPATEVNEQLLKLNKNYRLSYADNVDAGEAVVTIDGSGDYIGNTTSVTYRINGIPWTNVDPIADVYYNFGEHTPKPVVTWDSQDPTIGDNGVYTLEEGVDYELVYEDNQNAGTATVVIRGKGNFMHQPNEERVNFQIHPLPIDDTQLNPQSLLAGFGLQSTGFLPQNDTQQTLGEAQQVSEHVTVRTATKTYDGGNARLDKDGDIEVRYDNVLLTKGLDYEITGYENNSGVGTATVHIKGLGNFCEENSATFNILARDVNDEAVKVSEITEQFEFDGNAKVPEITLNLLHEADQTEIAMVKDTDYTLEYKDNVNAGTATITITGTGNYTGTRDITFPIAARNFDTITVSDVAIDPQGTPVTPVVVVKDGEKELELDKDYTLEYKDNAQVGTATVTARGIGNYVGCELTATFRIGRDGSSLAVADLESRAYTGAAIEPKLTVTDSTDAENPIVLTEGKDYTVKYKNNIEVGTATATVTGMGSYVGTIDKTFQIVARDADDMPEEPEQPTEPTKPTVGDNHEDLIPSVLADEVDPTTGVVNEPTKPNVQTEVDPTTGEEKVVVPDVIKDPETGEAVDPTNDPAPQTSDSTKYPNLPVDGQGNAIDPTSSEPKATDDKYVPLKTDEQGNPVVPSETAPVKGENVPDVDPASTDETNPNKEPKVTDDKYKQPLVDPVTGESKKGKDGNPIVGQITTDTDNKPIEPKTTDDKYTKEVTDPETGQTTKVPLITTDDQGNAIDPVEPKPDDAKYNDYIKTNPKTGEAIDPTDSEPKTTDSKYKGLISTDTDGKPIDPASTDPSNPNPKPDPKDYPKGATDPQYQQDIAAWQDKKDAYDDFTRDKSEWEKEKQAYDQYIKDHEAWVEEQQAYDQYTADKKAYDAYKADHDAWQDKKDAYDDYHNALDDWTEQKNAYDQYKNDHDDWQGKKDSYDAYKADHDAWQEKQDAWNQYSKDKDALQNYEQKKQAYDELQQNEQYQQYLEDRAQYENEQQNYDEQKAAYDALNNKMPQVGTVGRVTYNGKAQQPKPAVTLGGNAESPLVEGTDYTLTYKNNTNAGKATVTVAYKGNYKGSVDVQFDIDKLRIASVTAPDQSYNGTAKTPALTVKAADGSVVPAAAYTAKYEQNTNVGTATVTVTAKDNGNYTGSATGKFKIVPNSTGIAIAKPADVIYTGRQIKPQPKVTCGSKVLTLGTDYTLSYKNNLYEGTATVTATLKGNYSGTVSTNFQIKLVVYPDVDPVNHWARRTVSLASSLGLMSGYGNGNFGPADKLTRGQVATILWNLAGHPQPGANAKNFPDVKSDQYYTTPIAWASSVGVVSGYGTGYYGPNDPVTREQLAVMIANYARTIAKIDTTGSAADYSNASDASQVSGWAANSVGWCVKNKIISGGAGKINPRNNASRAETSAMVVSLYFIINP